MPIAPVCVELYTSDPGKISIQVDGVQLHGEHLSESSDDEALRLGILAESGRDQTSDAKLAPSEHQRSARKVRSTKLEAIALRMNQLRVSWFTSAIFRVFKACFIWKPMSWHGLALPDEVTLWIK